MTEATQPQEPEKVQEIPWVSPEDRVLDPSLLEKSLIDRMPKPTGWRLLVLPYKGRAKHLAAFIFLIKLFNRTRYPHKWVMFSKLGLSHTKTPKNLATLWTPQRTGCLGVKKAIG